MKSTIGSYFYELINGRNRKFINIQCSECSTTYKVRTERLEKQLASECGACHNLKLQQEAALRKAAMKATYQARLDRLEAKRVAKQEQLVSKRAAKQAKKDKQSKLLLRKSLKALLKTTNNLFNDILSQLRAISRHTIKSDKAFKRLQIDTKNTFRAKYGNAFDHPLYKTWCSMKDRCSRAKCSHYHNYGGRGIRVCDEWKNDFWMFVWHMGPKPSPIHTLDRIDNDYIYCPENCRWATPTEQRNNQRIIVNIE